MALMFAAAACMCIRSFIFGIAESLFLFGQQDHFSIQVTANL